MGRGFALGTLSPGVPPISSLRTIPSGLWGPCGSDTCWACSPVTARRRVMPLVSGRSPVMTRSPMAPVRSRCL